MILKIYSNNFRLLVEDSYNLKKINNFINSLKLAHLEK